MPALQVRDFPDDLYEKLKEYAQCNHRSVAQQTIVAVEHMLQENNVAENMLAGDNLTSAHANRGIRNYDSDTITQRGARSKMREDLFSQIMLSKNNVSPALLHPVDVVRQGRKERSTQLEESMYALPAQEMP